MTRTPDFGWSYPPGAANDPSAPYNQTDDGITLMQDEVFKLLDGYIPSKYIDDIMQLIQAGEQELFAAEAKAEEERLAEQYLEDRRLEREYAEWLETQDDREEP